MIDQRLVLHAILREHLFPFVQKVFELLHPGEEFLPSWHIEAICFALEQVVLGKIKRLIITVPPRYGKSICAAVALPAWLLGRDPTLKIMVASYGGDLGNKHAQDFRTVVSSQLYHDLFPGMRLAENRGDEQITTQRGSRKAVSLGGAVTGFGADYIIVDDIMKAADASSPAERQRSKEYFEQTLLSRLNDKKNGRIIVIQQRLHEDDLPGYLLETGAYHHLNLPAIAEEEQEIPYGFGRVKHRAKNDVLCEEREPLETLEQLRLEMGPMAFSAQYQQNPTPPGGNRVRWEWFPTFEMEDFRREDFQHVVQSWDPANDETPRSDFSAGTTWGFIDGKWYLFDLYRGRLSFPDLKRRISGWAKRHAADQVLIEKAGSGISLLQQLRREETRALYKPYVPKVDKVTRLEAQTAHMQSGRFLFPNHAPWLSDLKNELLGFPNARYDDQVDSITQFLEIFGSRSGAYRSERDPITGRPVGGNRRTGARR